MRPCPQRSRTLLKLPGNAAYDRNQLNRFAVDRTAGSLATARMARSVTEEPLVDGPQRLTRRRSAVRDAMLEVAPHMMRTRDALFCRRIARLELTENLGDSV